MRRTWPLVLGTAAIGVLAGVAIAGMPSQADPFVVDPSSLTLPPPATTTLPTTVPAAPAPAPTTTPTTLALTTSTEAPTTTAQAEVGDRSEVRVVVVNAAQRPGLAGRTASELAALGYTQVVPSDGLQVRDTSFVLFQPGFEDEAQRLAVDLGLPDAPVLPVGDEPQSPSDADGDLIAVLGRDR